MMQNHPVFHNIVRSLLLFSAVLLIFSANGQEDEWGWWNTAHNWKSGMPGWRTMMILSPGFLGPNALPVPEMKKGCIPSKGEIETTFSCHFHPGDPTQDLSFRLFYPVANGKMAFEAWGVALERYHYSEEIRDERFSRDKNGKGVMSGDFYFSALVQLCKNRKFPDTMLRLACKTASGDAFAARYTDTPGYFFDFSSARDITLSEGKVLKPFASFGFYSWQTYNEATPQNDAILYGVGVDYSSAGWLVSGNLSGYSGYLRHTDRPRVLTLESRYDWNSTALRCQFLYGIKDWDYKTVRLSFIWKI
jgi:hypothetical protein